MADEIAELVVKITGDASGLESTINGVASELSALEKAQGSSTAANSAATKGLAAYKKQMSEAETTLSKSRTALANTKKAYEDNQKSVTKNVSALKSQKSELDKQIALRSNEKRLLTEANKHLDENSTAYKDNQKAIRWINTEIGTYTEQSKRISDSIRTQENALAGSKKAYEDAQATVSKATQQYKEYENGLAAVERAEKAQNLQNTGKQWKEVGEGVDTITKPLQYTAMALAAGGVAAAKFAIDFEDSFASVKKTVDGTPEQLDAIKQSIIDMSTVGINGHSAIPMTTAELNELAAAGGQLGIQTENIADFTEVMAQMGTATNLVGEEGAATLARFMNVMGISQGEIRNVGSAIVDLGNNSATTESEIAAMALRMGKYGSTIGMSAADVLGYSAALSSLGIEAQMGGSAIGRTWLSIESAVASGGDALKAFAKYSGKSAKEFKEQWNTDSKGAFNGLLKGLQSADNLTLALDKLGINNTQDIQAMMALVNGYDLVTASVERANTAYAENTALQAEFDAKAETTASQLAIVKNNFVEAARSIGETMLPTIKDASAGLADWAQKLASMDDSQKKTLVNTAAGVVALGAASKGLSTGVKTVGNFVEGIGKLASAAPGIAAVAPEIALVAAGITALGVAGKVTYDKLYEAEYKWADGMQESAEAISKNAAEVTKLTDLQKEVSDLKLVINSPDSSTEQVETAQQRIKEIAELLSKEHNLKINADTANVESALNLLEMEKRRDFMDSGSDYLETMRANRDSYIEAPKKISGFDNDLNKLERQKRAYEDIASSLGNLKRDYDDGTISQKKYLDGFVDLLNKAEQTAGFDGWELAQGAVGNEDPATGLQNALTFATNLEKMIEKLGGEYKSTKQEYDDLTETQRIFEESAKFAAQGYSQVLASDILNGNWGDVAQVTQAFQTLGKEMKAAGANTDDVAKEFATAKQGFTDFQKAIDAGAGDAMANDFIAYKKSIGDIAEEAVKGAALIKSGFSDVSQVTAETLPTVLNNMRELGNAQGLDMTAEKLTQMAQAIKLIPQNTKIEFDGEGNIVLKVDDTEVEEYEAPDKPGKAPYSPDTSQVDAWTPPEKQGKVIYNAVMPEQFKNTNYGKFGANVFPSAQGTQNFPGGLAMVNDQTGIADNRELIIDRGRAFIPQGRNVILPLSKGAKVYTAAQTKAIMSGLGIPHYAEGKNNSDAFTAARDDWTHYTKTHAVTTAQELQKWLELQEQFKDNEKDIWDIEEQIFSLMQKQTKELNDQSKEYLEERAALNDWEEVGDSPIEAFGRIKDRNYQDLQDAKITWDDYVKNVSDAGKTLYEAMLDQSDTWLEDQRKYHNMSVDDYIAGINREQQRLEEFYAADMLNYKEYVEYRRDLANKEADAIAEKNADEYAAWQKDADAWQELRSTYGGWDKYGDNEEDFLKRKIERVKKFYEAGKISFEEFIDDTNEYSMDLYKAQEGYVDDLLQKQSDYISDLRDQFSKQEQALRDSWDVEDRAIDMADVQNQLDIYEGAVTDRGQQKYKELQEQMKQLRRDEELYNLQVANNATIESLEAEYKQMEEGKANILEGLRTANVNISAYVDSISENLSQTGGRVESLLGQLLTAFNGFQINAPSTTYADNRTVNVSGLSLSEFASRYMGGLKI